MGLRASIPTRRAAAVLILASVIVSFTINRAIAQASASAQVADAQADFVARGSAHPTPRVLLLGDSVMDQQGSAAAFLLRQAGVDATTVGLWGSGLLTTDQYDNGKTNLSGMWFTRARKEIVRHHPDVIGVYLNHNYWPPYPRDAAGRPITDLFSPAGQQMIGEQARAFITILRAHGARVFFVAPIPAGLLPDPDPAAWDAIWRGYLPVLHELHVPIASTAGGITGANGLRVETKATCDGTEQRVRPEGDLHLTRFGAGLAGTGLAEYVAHIVHVDLLGNAAPGDRAAALVPTRDGNGYWLVGCDGSVYHFGRAPHLPGARAAVAGHGGVVAAAAAPSGTGLWLVTADGTIASAGDAPPLSFAAPPDGPIVGAAGVPGHAGIWAVTATGTVIDAGDADDLGGLPAPPPGAPVVAITATPNGRGYFLATAAGPVFGFGDAHVAERTTSAGVTGPVVGIASTDDGQGYWLVAADGSVDAAGDARFRGTGTWHTPPYPYTALRVAPGPTVGIAAAPRSDAGYWVLGSTGRVVARGNARHLSGDNNLALFTQ